MLMLSLIYLLNNNDSCLGYAISLPLLQLYTNLPECKDSRHTTSTICVSNWEISSIL